MTPEDFQSLSRCEALMAHREVGDEVLRAFMIGVRLAVRTADKPFFTEFKEAFQQGLRDIGFNPNNFHFSLAFEKEE